MEGVKEVHKDIPKSPQDDRDYRGLLLENGLKVLLIHDSSTDKSAAAMDVHIGSLTDPKELPGLAHFCEHMLFLGTEKYPGENAYTQFLTENGGSSNAFTSGEHTNYFFDVKYESLSNALDRFAQFFLCPLFNADAKDREVNAVDSENSKNRLNDMWRLNQLDKSTVDPSHPYNKFCTGNKLTLDTRPKEKGIDTREELLKFHSLYYSANIMSLSVIGRESLDEMTEMVVKLFSPVQNKNVTIPTFPEHPYGAEQVQTLFKVVPVKDMKNLNLMFPIPDMSKYYHFKPSHYISHLIGHEGEGSLLSELKAKGWVNALVAGALDGAKGFMFFMCNMELTNEGQDHIFEISTSVFQYLEMLRREEPFEWVFEECKALAEVRFRFNDKETPRSYVCHLARSLHDFSIDDVLRGPHLLTSFRPDLIKQVLDNLVPEKVRITIVSKAFEGKTDKTEEWYGTEYSMERIDQQQIKDWKNVSLNAALTIPKKNEFIPTDLDIRPAPGEDSPLTKVWFKQDVTFLLPKACMLFEITSPLAYIDPCHCNMAYIFLQLLKDSLNEYAYDAEIAGVTYNLDNTMYGIFMSIRGYNHKQGILMEKILKRMTKFKVDPNRFRLIKERYEQGLRNFKAEQPHQHALYYTSYLLEELAWHKDELIDALEEVTIEKLQAFIPQLLGRLHIECLLHGNVTEKEALGLVDTMESIFTENSGTKPLLPLQLRRHREIQLPHTVNHVHSNSSIEIYYQCDLQETRSNMLLELFCQVIHESCFNILRTQEQLGYIVFSGPRRGNGAQGLRFIIQSDKEPSLLDSRVEVFLDKTKEMIESMTDEEFKNHIDALAVRRLDKPKKLRTETQKHWGEILTRQYNFDRDNVEVAFLRTLTKDDLLNFYKDLLEPSAPRRHKLAVHILPNTTCTYSGRGDLQERTTLASISVSLRNAHNQVQTLDSNECWTLEGS
ncbi:predicted protein [Nematostella vectensis]|uniref:Insulin-degrading enzyme n=1 Tax=Nematostella vectensis TaxID=45351 RepID=A7SEX7_NEMVE|nr:predicted protein [Nematostella vectensis]|eukprot:XP_001629798.1 predicted protein [Nematostella vectensis]